MPVVAKQNRIQPKGKLKFDLGDKSESKWLLVYMKWWLYNNPVDEERKN